MAAPASTLTFGGRIHFARQAGSVWRRRMKSTSDQNLALEALRRPAVVLSEPRVPTQSIKAVESFRARTWVVRNDLAGVFGAAAGAAAGGRTKAS